MFETLLATTGLLMAFVHFVFWLAILGAMVWLLVEFASIIFKLFAYGFLTVLALGGLVWFIV